MRKLNREYGSMKILDSLFDPFVDYFLDFCSLAR